MNLRTPSEELRLRRRIQGFARDPTRRDDLRWSAFQRTVDYAMYGSKLAEDELKDSYDDHLDRMGVKTRPRSGARPRKGPDSPPESTESESLAHVIAQEAAGSSFLKDTRRILGVGGPTSIPAPDYLDSLAIGEFRRFAEEHPDLAEAVVAQAMSAQRGGSKPSMTPLLKLAVNLAREGIDPLAFLEPQPDADMADPVFAAGCSAVHGASDEFIREVNRAVLNWPVPDGPNVAEPTGDRPFAGIVVYSNPPDSLVALPYYFTHGVLAAIDMVARKLAELYSWTQSEAAAFFLSGTTPPLRRFRRAVCRTVEGSMPALTRINMDIDPRMSPREVMAAYEAQRSLTMAHSRPLSLRSRALGWFIGRRCICDIERWADKMREWNAWSSDFPEWPRYSDSAVFRRDALHARARMLDPELRLRARPAAHPQTASVKRKTSRKQEPQG